MSDQQMSYKYSNKVVLAPMVRVGTLPMRLLSLDYGADLVYCEEIIDRKILNTTRTENGVLGTTDYTMCDGTVVFRTCPREKEKIIFQLGTCDAKRALAAARKVEKDVAGIDVNMGCPKEFSIKGGMGCALLSQPDKIKQILTTLVEGLSIPVSCKIRVFPEVEETVKLAKLIESTGVVALAVHGRTRDERPQHKNRNGTIRAIAQALSIPVIANGGSKEIIQHEDIEQFRKAAGASSVMIARQAEWNCSIFRKEGKLPLYDVIKAYLKYAFQYDNNDINTKYCVLQMMHETMDRPEGQASLTAKTNEEFSEIWGLRPEFQHAVQDRRQQTDRLQELSADGNHGFKRRKADDGLPLIELPVRFDKKCYLPAMSPKQSLHEWCYRCHYKNPVYQTEERPSDRSFNSRVLVDGKWYTTPFWEKRKQYAEQSAAMCCLLTHDLHDGRVKEPEDQTPELRHKWHQLALSEKHGNVTGVGGGGDARSGHDSVGVDSPDDVSSVTESSGGKERRRSADTADAGCDVNDKGLDENSVS
ncbi:tRNA-dihydrouridine(20) synthase [NAD(P)+]-like [Babylonia areolata]|uniref:tRNA-dihydrouridine(20) synthase [NAD(P)+]-like n=1 Tax=Babylonia areolata TaxID=304850 RepID=UPI003FD58682